MFFESISSYGDALFFSMATLVLFHLLCFLMYKNRRAWKSIRKSFVATCILIVSIMLFPKSIYTKAKLDDISRLSIVDNEKIAKIIRSYDNDKFYNSNIKHQKNIASMIYSSSGKRIQIQIGKRKVKYEPSRYEILDYKSTGTINGLLLTNFESLLYLNNLYLFNLLISIIAFLIYVIYFRKKEKSNSSNIT